MQFTSTPKDKNVHLLSKTGKTVCKLEAADASVIFLGRSVCSSCLATIRKEVGEDISDYAELVFYFNKYNFQSEFLTSVYNLVMLDHKAPTPKQVSSALKLFRKGLFIKNTLDIIVSMNKDDLPF